MVSYRELSDKLEQVMLQLQSGDLSLDEAIKQYEVGAKLITQMQTELQKAENKIEKIKAGLGKD